MVYAIQSGILTEATKERLETLEDERRSIKASINKAMIERPIYTKEELISWISHFKYGDIKDKKFQKEVVDTFLNSVYVYDDKLILYYNYKDGIATLPSDIIKSGAISTNENACLPSESPP